MHQRHKGNFDLVIQLKRTNTVQLVATFVCYYSHNVHYRKLWIYRQPKAVGVGKITVGLGLPSAYQPVGTAKKAVGIVPSAYFFSSFLILFKKTFTYIFLFYSEISHLVTHLNSNSTHNLKSKYLSWSKFPFGHPSSPSTLNFWVPSKLVSKWEIRTYWYYYPINHIDPGHDVTLFII